MMLNHTRRDPMYESIMTDLVLMGALDKRVVEAFTGTKISEHLKPPAAFTELVDEQDTDD